MYHKKINMLKTKRLIQLTLLMWIIAITSCSKVQEKGEVQKTERASEIVRELKANYFVEFIVGRADVLKRTINASKGDWLCGYMNTAMSPSSFQQNGYTWANFSISSIFFNNGKIQGNYSVDDYSNNGIRVSVFNVDNDENRAWYITKMDKLYAITTNYPKALLERIENY